ncbi:hypothetical protein QZH41_017381 [Actinostola sp. cb2023]|nr:hypothetical protein QZH41_017381 [Actinostola sp. cb2023]
MFFEKIFCSFLVWLTTTQADVLPWLKPGDVAPGFSLQTPKELLTYKKGQPADIKGPVVMLAFTNESAFLENMLSNPKEFVFDLFEHSPGTAHYIFMFYDNASLDKNCDASRAFKKKLIPAMYRYHILKSRRYMAEIRRLPRVNNYRMKYLTPRTLLQHWLSRLHFVQFPVHMLGNWIPRVLSQWHCYGPFCGFDQIATENQNGKRHVQLICGSLHARESSGALRRGLG